MRSIHSYQLPYAIKSKLHDSGFCFDKDFKHVTPEKLQKETGLSLDDVNTVLNTIINAPSPLNKCTTGNISLQKEQSSESIITFSQKIDQILGGGVPLCKITEICGCPGTGKTQLCLQLCIDVQIPITMGGIDGEAIFIDTERTFFTQRLIEIASATVEHCNLYYSNQTLDLKDFTVDKILNGIQYINCKSYVELLAIVNQLPQIIDKNDKIKLIIIDSIAFHFRYGYDDTFYKRTKILNNVAKSLIKLATHKNLAVVWTNQMTTKFGEKQIVLVPSLGDNFAHNCNLKLILYWDNETRKALLQKSPFNQETVAPFQILSVGIRDIPVDTENKQPSKRLKTLHHVIPYVFASRDSLCIYIT